MFASLRWKLILSYVILAIFSVSVVGLVSVEIWQYFANQQQLKQLKENAQAIAKQAAPLLSPIVRYYELNQLAETTSYLGNLRIKILDIQQRALIDSGLPNSPNEYVILQPGGSYKPAYLEGTSIGDWMALPLGDLNFASGESASLLSQLPPEIAWVIVRRMESPWGIRVVFIESSQLQAGETNSETSSSSQANRSGQSWLEPIRTQNELVGYVEVSSSVDLTSSALFATRQAFLLAAVSTGLLAVLLGLFMSQRIFAPVSELKSAALQMGTGDLSVRAPVHADDELGALAHNFNTMAQQLEASFSELATERDALRRFIADASHELRTPITALKNFLALLQDPTVRDQTVREEFLNESQNQVERLEWITSNLLDLSRLDAGLLKLELDRHSAADLLSTSAAPFIPTAEARRVALDVLLPAPDFDLVCDFGRIQITLTNLIDNALKFTPPGGSVQVGVKQIGTGVELFVRDSGPGISDEDLPHIFERFYRGRHQEMPGSGLGLSIVQSIVRAHQGEIQVQSSPNNGTEIRILLPQPENASL